nr:unnamed protein product [Callosobruchus analis]
MSRRTINLGVML